MCLSLKLKTRICQFRPLSFFFSPPRGWKKMEKLFHNFQNFLLRPTSSQSGRSRLHFDFINSPKWAQQLVYMGSCSTIFYAIVSGIAICHCLKLLWGLFGCTGPVLKYPWLSFPLVLLKYRLSPLCCVAPGVWD